jgi:UV DNA damage endonuclease
MLTAGYLIFSSQNFNYGCGYMKIRLGYVAISMRLPDSSPNKTVTLKSLEKIDKKMWNSKVEKISKLNIANTMRIIRYNDAYGIKLYRLTSKIVPLATHRELSNWDWKTDLKNDFKELGKCIKETSMRVSTHPDHFTLLNSPRSEVLEASIKDLDYHCSMFELMELDSSYKMVLHIGGVYKNKEESIKRFYDGFNILEERIKSRIILENDDKMFNAADVLKISNELGVPMVLDVHHDKCNPSPYEVRDIIKDVFATWRGEKFPPKVHLSSPKSEKDFRSHHDFINLDDFALFINKSKEANQDVDVMIEAKMKDSAVFKLIEDMIDMPGIIKAGGASIEVLYKNI